jgi:hypothetical protein
MAEFVYILCAVTSLACTVLLLRSYREVRTHLLFWSGACFLLLSLSNALIFVDVVIMPNVNLLTLRNMLTLCGLSLLLYALVRDNT